MSDLLARAREIAEEVLLPVTIEVDRTGVVPKSHLDLLAEEGFYGLVARPDVDFAEACQVLETLASGCLCTTFVWMQHNGVVLRLAHSPDWSAQLTTGSRRAGVALGGTLPGPPRLTAQGDVLNGHSPWVTGWGMIDTLLVAARDGDDIVWSLVDAKESDTLSVEPLDMVAVSASNTVTATFTEHPVPADRIVSRQPYAEWVKADAAGLRMNGSLALGLTARCCALLGPSHLDAELAATRTRLNTVGAEEMPDARAEASALAARAATMLVATKGSSAILKDQHPPKASQRINIPTNIRLKANNKKGDAAKNVDQPNTNRTTTKSPGTSRKTAARQRKTTQTEPGPLCPPPPIESQPQRRIRLVKSPACCSGDQSDLTRRIRRCNTQKTGAGPEYSAAIIGPSTTELRSKPPPAR